MAILYDKIEGRAGAGIPGVYVRLLVGGVVQPLFADVNNTPIVTVSGVANAAKTDANGNYVLYVADGTYDLEVLDKDAATRVLPLIEGVVPQSAVTVAQITALKDETVAASETAITAKNTAAASAAAGEIDADRAESAASDAEAFAGLVYASQAAGEAATTTGQRFRVAIGTTPETYNSYERRVSGSVLMAPLATTTALASSTRTLGASLVGMEDGRTVQAAITADAARAHPYVNALALGRATASGNADVVATSAYLQQPIATSGTEKWRGNVRANGLHFHVPFDADTLLIHNPDTGKMWRMTAAELGLSSSAFSGTQKWNRGVVGRDGRIYCIPYDAVTVLVIDPVALTATLETFGLPTAPLSAADKWSGGAMDANGIIWCAPYGSVTVLAIDTVNQTARTYTATQLGLVLNSLNGSAKYSGAVCVDGKVYCVSFGAANVLVITASAATATHETYGLTLSDGTKWSGAAVVGTLIYCCPYSSEDILVIDTVAATAVRHNMGPAGVSTPLTGANKWRDLVRVGGKLYGIPANSINFLVIDTLTTGAGINTYGTAARDNFDAYDIRRPTTTGNLVSSLKWAGGLVYKGIIYGCPSGTVQAGQDILFLDPVAEQAYHGDGRALNDDSAATKWFGGVQHPNGYAYTIPASAQDFLIIKDDDPTNDSPLAFRSTLGLLLNANAQKFQGGALLGDNCIYAMPRSGETNMLKIDPSDLSGSRFGTATLFGANTATIRGGAANQPLATGTVPALGGVNSQAYHSCVVGMDGKLYGIPYSSTRVLIFDYRAAPGSQLELTDFGLDLSGADKWVGGALHPNGKIYCGPRSRDTCLVIDTNPLSATYNTAVLTNFGTNLQTGAGVGIDPAQLAMKWSYPKVGADGRIYVGPRKAANLLVIDPSDTSVSADGKATFEDFGLDMSSFQTIDGYSIATKMGPDGKLYIAALEGLGPTGTGPFLVVDTVTRTASFEDFGLPSSGSNSINTGNKCAGAIHTLAGAIIFVPRSGLNIIRLRPKCRPLPVTAALSPMMFAN